MAKQLSDRKLMQIAIEQSKLSKNADKFDPLVGAVIARNGHVLATGFREEVANHHAEGSALSKITNDAAVGADVFTTLEPRTKRDTRTPCTDLLATASGESSSVFDPNRDIRGEGFWAT